LPAEAVELFKRLVQADNMSGNRRSTIALRKELFQLCRSESLSEDGLREILERYGCAPNNEDYNIIDDYNFFFAACRNEFVTEGILRCLLEYFPRAAFDTCSEGSTPLHEMCFVPHVTRGMVQLLVHASPESLSRVDNAGNTPLHILCINRDIADSTAVDILSLLLERCPGAVRHATTNSALPIHFAAESKSPEFCRMLIEAYPGSERIPTPEDGFPLHIACGHGAVATAEYLYQLYPECINLVDDGRGYYPIHCAIARLRSETPTIAVEMVHMLLDCDQSVVVSQEFHGVSPLCLVYIMGSAGVFPAFSSRYNFAPVSDVLRALHLLYDAQPEAIENMIDAPYNMSPEEMQIFITAQRTYARQSRDLTFMSTRNENGQLPLHQALRDNVILGSIKLLVKGNPIAVQTADNDGALPLHLAIQHHDSTKVVDYLIGLDPNTLTAVDREGNTALHHACCSAKHEIIALLLEKYGAVSVSKKNSLNKLPIHLLSESNAVADRDDTKYTESIFQLLRAYPDTVMM
jgi:ankyrin repeat protein